MGNYRPRIVLFSDIHPSIGVIKVFKYDENTHPPALFAALTAFSEGRCGQAWRLFGAHPARDAAGTEGYFFRTWAPKAKSVAVIGDFNQWNTAAHPMTALPGGVWEVFIPALKQFDRYQYAIETASGSVLHKADPFAFHADTRPGTASKLYNLTGGHAWGDQAWLNYRARQDFSSPMNIYECHLGSWRRTGEGTFLSYRDTTAYLVPYLKEMGYTHVELLPVMEHPLDGSWGYQCTGYFAATSRFGTPDDLKYLIDQLHQAGIGVILDWVPAHFPRDDHGLSYFDGTPTFEYADPQKQSHPDWGTNCFDLSKPEVRSFLLSSAMFWLEEFHADGLRVDAVSSMLYLNFGRKEGEWTPNEQGGAENLEAVQFLQQLNTAVRTSHPDVLMIAEEATAWPGVTAPVEKGGLGFHLKWNMGWMNDTCRYIKTDPYFRQFHHKDLTFPMTYAFDEAHILPLSHDEVVHKKGSFFGKMPGDNDQIRFSGVRAFYAYLMTQPGKKLSFMGMELGQWKEWDYRYSLDWHLLQYDRHRQNQHFFQSMNAYYLAQDALWELDDGWDGFQWLSPDDSASNVIAYLRVDKAGKPLLVVCNFSTVRRPNYRVGAPIAGAWTLDFSTDDLSFGGHGLVDRTPVKTEKVPCHGQDVSMVLDLPPLSCVIYRCSRKNPTRKPKVEVDEQAHGLARRRRSTPRK